MVPFVRLALLLGELLLIFCTFVVLFSGGRYCIAAADFGESDAIIGEAVADDDGVVGESS